MYNALPKDSQAERVTMFSVYSLTITVALSALINTVGSRIVSTANDRPVIGILAQTSSGTYKQFGDSFIYTDYVKFLQTGGASVVPVRINEPLEYYTNLFNSINGVLFPGGGVPLESPYGKTGKIFFELALKANKAGDYFPVWGTCLGFQLLTYLVAGQDLLTSTDAKNLPLPLDLVSPEYEQSELLGKAPADILHILQTESITDNDHSYGIEPQVFSKNAKLTNFFRMLSTNEGRNKTTFVSSMEGREYPVWGVQFHPEQSYNFNPGFKWLHNSHAVQVTQYFANFLVDRARRSKHSFPDQTTAMSAMIENNPVIYLKEHDPFESIYVFNVTRSP